MATNLGCPRKGEVGGGAHIDAPTVVEPTQLLELLALFKVGLRTRASSAVRVKLKPDVLGPRAAPGGMGLLLNIKARPSCCHHLPVRRMDVGSSGMDLAKVTTACRAQHVGELVNLL